LKRGGGITQFPMSVLYKFIAETREAAAQPPPEDKATQRRHKKTCDNLKLIDAAKIQETEPLELFKQMFKARMSAGAPTTRA
jgi:hypothetical protein